MTEAEGCLPTSEAQADTAPARIVVRASQDSAETAPFILLLGIGGTGLCWLTLTGHVDAPSRYRSELVQSGLLITGIALTVYAAALLVARRKGRSRLIEIDENNVHVRTIRGAVDIAVHDVARIATNKDGRLVVFDGRGRKYIPVLAPESADWASVAAKLNESLDMIRRSRSAQQESTSMLEPTIAAPRQTDDVSSDVPAPSDPPTETSTHGVSPHSDRSP